jgi:hypothetical protein
MIRMVALMDEVFLWDGSDGLGLRNRSFLLQCQLGPFRGSNREELPCYLARKNLGKQRRYGIADLSLHGHASSNEFEVSRKGLNPRHLFNAKPAILPVEWTYR